MEDQQRETRNGTKQIGGKGRQTKKGEPTETEGNGEGKDEKYAKKK